MGLLYLRGCTIQKVGDEMMMSYMGLLYSMGRYPDSMGIGHSIAVSFTNLLERDTIFNTLTKLLPLHGWSSSCYFIPTIRH